MGLIETSNLRKSFRIGRGVVEAVRGIDMRVEAGEIFGFLGPNGAGKTTTLRMLTTLLAPSGGRAMVAGYDVQREAERVRARIGYVSQAGGVDGNATGRENVELQAKLYNVKNARAHAAELLAALELEGYADRLAMTYSGGQKRRLALALGMVHRPSILFLDEPTTGLDPQSRARLWDEVRNLRATGTTVFLTTHYLEEADALCDRVAIIDDGKIIAEGAPGILKSAIGHDVVTLGLEAAEDTFRHTQDLLRGQMFVREVHRDKDELRLYIERGEERLPLIIQMLTGVGVGIRTISLAHPTLDDVFLRLTGRSLRDAEKPGQQAGNRWAAKKQATARK